MADTEEQISELLEASRGGDAAAGERLLTALYEELRRIARRERRRLYAGETLNTTVVVHEVYLRLLSRRDLPWESRSHLLATSAVAMRRLLIDHARARQAAKRGGGALAVELRDDDGAADRASDEILAVDEALGHLARRDPRLARLVELRFFGGLSEEEIAKVLEISERTVRRDWTRARAFLHHILGAGPGLPDRNGT